MARPRTDRKVFHDKWKTEVIDSCDEVGLIRDFYVTQEDLVWIGLMRQNFCLNVCERANSSSNLIDLAFTDVYFHSHYFLRNCNLGHYNAQFFILQEFSAVQYMRGNEFFEPDAGA